MLLQLGSRYHCSLTMHADEPTPPFTAASQLEPPDHHVNFTGHPLWHGQAFAHLNCTPALLEGLADELTTSGSTMGKKIVIFPSPATRPSTWCT